MTVSAKTRLVRTSMCIEKNEILKNGEITCVTKKIYTGFYQAGKDLIKPIYHLIRLLMGSSKSFVSFL